MQHLNHSEGMNYGSEDDDEPLDMGLRAFSVGRDGGKFEYGRNSVEIFSR